MDYLYVNAISPIHGRNPLKGFNTDQITDSLSPSKTRVLPVTAPRCAAWDRRRCDWAVALAIPAEERRADNSARPVPTPSPTPAALPVSVKQPHSSRFVAKILMDVDRRLSTWCGWEAILWSLGDISQRIWKMKNAVFEGWNRAVKWFPGDL